MKNLTRVKILPTRVESKNNIGALKIEVVKLKKKALEAFNPRCAPMLVLRNANAVMKMLERKVVMDPTLLRLKITRMLQRIR
ncbi:hypothetical protein JHK82_018792 [Glycine max]|nr:hypothetical protein JHK85_019233 [Glycine max]KAG5037969.1 hypothetical protein JHK86_018809 [Glycine max]KAG5143097.1 hypothetical protein JHK82_018792 [Glycine max]